nr:hypothetical protein [Tanacetum cinerariifolium]
VVSWKATLQHVVALSTAEAEIIRVLEAMTVKVLKVKTEHNVVDALTNVGCVVSWKATLQHVVALSTTEAEYMSLTETVKEASWLKVLEAMTVKVLKVKTEHNAVDALTNVVPELKLQHCFELLNVGVG